MDANHSKSNAYRPGRFGEGKKFCSAFSPAKREAGEEEKRA